MGKTPIEETRTEKREGAGKKAREILKRFIRLCSLSIQDLQLVVWSVTLFLEGEEKTRNRQNLETNGNDTLHSKVTCSVMALDDSLLFDSVLADCKTVFLEDVS